MINKLLNKNFITSISCFFLFTLLSIMIITIITYENYAFAATYNYEPFFTANGSNKIDVSNAQNLKLSSFTVATWFKTTANFPDEGVMVNKGGLGSESSGANQNYGIWFTPSERLQGGFETTGGTNKYITSANTYNDGQWHHGVVTFDNPNNIVRLFVDGVQIGTLSTSSNPDNTGSQPLRIAGNAQSLTEDFFIGQLDEVGVWNRALTSTEIFNLMNDGLFPSSGLVYSNSFNTSTPEICNDNIDNDGDGLKDAEDVDSCTSVPEICNNGLDDDRDGLKDTADPDCQTSTGYNYTPFFTATGSNKIDVSNAQNLRLSSFTVATWFKTTANFPDEGVMVNKGGLGSESSGANQNYGIWFTPSERLQGGFETTGGTNKYITSANTYNDGQWHHGVVTFDNPNNIVRLFVDGVQIGTLSTSSNPDNTGSQPLRIAGNAQSLTEDFFIGQLDEVGVWNRALTSTEIFNLMNDGFFATSGLANGLVFSNSFDNLPTPPEICGDGKDNDGDILIDEGCPQLPPPLNFKFAYKFGTKGNGNGQFQDPHDVSFDSSGNVFVPDRVRNDIQKFTHEGVFLSKFGGPGSGPGQFNVPYSIAHDSNNNIYVSDRENNRIQKLTNDGVFITELKSINGKNFVMPEDLAFDFTNGDLYITDTGNNRIVKLDKNLNFILQWGSKGTGDGQFDHPHAIDVGPDRNVYVSSGFQPYIQKFDPNGNFIKKWGKEGSGDGEMLMFLEHLDVDSEGRVYLINNNIRPVVQVWDSEGNYLTKFGSEKEGSADGQLAEPEHVTVDNDGKPFIVDSGNFRIQVFTPEVVNPSNFGQLFTREVVNPQQPPQPQEICNNGIDDDGDGLKDTAYSDCQTPEVCNDNKDNDGDGLVDIADPDCQQDFLSRLPSMVSPFTLQ